MRTILVVGTNNQGIPGAGAALYAHHNKGLKRGHVSGLCGDTYAICTKDLRKGIRSVDLSFIQSQVLELKQLATDMLNEDVVFDVTPIGCGRAGFRYDEIAPMFRNCPTNMELPSEFIAVLKTLPMKWNLNEIALVQVGSNPAHSFTVKVMEVQGEVVVITPHMTEELMNDASTFMKMFGANLSNTRYFFESNGKEIYERNSRISSIPFTLKKFHQ